MTWNPFPTFHENSNFSSSSFLFLRVSHGHYSLCIIAETAHSLNFLGIFRFLFIFSSKVKMADVEETIKRIQAQKGVVGVIVMDSLGKINIFLV